MIWLARIAAVGSCVLALAAIAADASCAPPAPLAERIAGADAIVHGTVAAFEGGSPRSLMVEVRRVYKGRVVGLIFVAAGPGGEGGGPAPAATSVDYQAARGTDHTFYLTQHAPAGFSTNACEGSHAGPPGAEELAALGDGTAPERGATGVSGATDAERALAMLAVVAAIALGAAVVWRTRRRTAAGQIRPPAPRH